MTLRQNRQEIVHQSRNFFTPLPQRQYVNMPNTEPVKEIGGKVVTRHRLSDVLCCSCDDPDVYRSGIRFSNSLKFAVLEIVDKFLLEKPRKKGHFLEQEATAMSLINETSATGR